MPRMNCLITILFTTIATSIIAETGSFTGEQLSGINKICYYNGVNGAFAKTVTATTLCPLTANDGKISSSSGNTPLGGFGTGNSGGGKVFGSYSGEENSGTNKICYYTSARGTFTKTMNILTLCPLNASQ